MKSSLVCQSGFTYQTALTEFEKGHTSRQALILVRLFMRHAIYYRQYRNRILMSLLHGQLPGRSSCYNRDSFVKRVIACNDAPTSHTITEAHSILTHGID